MRADGTVEAPAIGPRTKIRLVALSFVMLFVELALIRWTASNNIYFAYLTNFVLLGSFLGIGVGFLRPESKRDPLGLAAVSLAVLVAFGLAFPVDLVRFTGPTPLVGEFGMIALPSWLSLSIIFALTVVIMTGLARAVARTFALFTPLQAYRFDILGSIAGIAAFSTLAFLKTPPLAWGIVSAIAIVVLMGRSIKWWTALALVAIVLLLGLESFAPNEHWSPYYKITAVHDAAKGSLTISANNIPHQTAHPLSTLRSAEEFRFFPYRHMEPPRNVLIIGAGTGNDLSVALSEGATHIDAVEIDPVIQRLGRTFHADGPYKDPRVTVHIDDGRAFMQRSKDRYDLIILALPDSLTLLAGQSNLRLENYLFTTEAMRSAREHLAPGGTFVMYNYYEPFLLDRYAGTLASVYGTPPCVELGERLAGRQQAVLTAPLTGETPNCATKWQGAAIEPATDDHPFPYLRTRSIPGIYLRWLAVIALVSLIVIRVSGGPFRRMKGYGDLALMGGAFLLLETKNVVQFALLFGTTWLVNSLVFAGVLVSVLAAIEVASRFRLPRPSILFAGLAVSLGVAWAVPPGSLLGLSPAPRFIAATAIAFAPIFLANLIFSRRFRDVGSSTAAFGANLLGAMIGGGLEYLALVSGYRFLIILVAALYGLAYLLDRKGSPATV